MQLTARNNFSGCCSRFAVIGCIIVVHEALIKYAERIMSGDIAKLTDEPNGVWKQVAESAMTEYYC